jgi:serine protease Do
MEIAPDRIDRTVQAARGAAAMWLTIRTGPSAGKSVQATGSRFVIGREEGCDLLLEDPEVSRQHAFISVTPDGGAELHDLGSANGTRVNGRLIHGSTPLRGGERIQMGSTELVTSLRPPASPTVVQGAGAGAPPAAAQETGDGAGRARPRAAIIAAVAAVVVAVAIVLALFLTGTIGDDDEPSVADVVDEARSSVVVVSASTGTGLGGTGSGWVLDAERGLIVTNHHVINAGSLYTAGVKSGEAAAGEENAPLEEQDATVVGTAPCEDLAVLRTDPTGLRTLPLAAEGELRQGDQVIALGFPGTESDRTDYVQTSGTASDVRTSLSNENLRIDVPDLPDLVLTDTPVNPGNSGGPLINLEGHAVGVVVGSQLARQNQNYAIGVDRVREVVGRLRRGVSIGWTGLGLDFLPELSGAIITNVVPGTPAAAADIDPPQLLTAIEAPRSDPDKLEGTLADYCSAVAGLTRGESFVIRMRPLREDPDGGYLLADAPVKRVRISLK